MGGFSVSLLAAHHLVLVETFSGVRGVPGEPDVALVTPIPGDTRENPVKCRSRGTLLADHHGDFAPGRQEVNQDGLTLDRHRGLHLGRVKRESRERVRREVREVREVDIVHRDTLSIFLSESVRHLCFSISH